MSLKPNPPLPTAYHALSRLPLKCPVCLCLPPHGPCPGPGLPPTLSGFPSPTPPWSLALVWPPRGAQNLLWLPSALRGKPSSSPWPCIGLAPACLTSLTEHPFLLGTLCSSYSASLALSLPSTPLLPSALFHCLFNNSSSSRKPSLTLILG